MRRFFGHFTLGLFVASGIALLGFGVYLLGVRRDFRRHAALITYFDQSVNGLHEGAEVKWRGVTVGTVAQIWIRHDQAPDDFATPVLLHLDRDDLRRKVDDRSDVGSRPFLESWIQRGLRAHLESESRVSGKLFVELTMVPGDPLPRPHQLRPEYVEIPATPTEVQRLLANFGRINFQELSRRMTSAQRELDKDMADLNLKGLAQRLTETRDTLNRARTAADLATSQRDLATLLDEAKRLAAQFGVRLGPVATGASDLLSRTRTDLSGATRRLATPDPGAGGAADLRAVLADLTAAQEALSGLLATLKRDPAVILTGNPPAPPLPHSEPPPR
ncbi:MAG: MCE family protein [Verrucomicrobia bacterium]|nr:MCE family protein [Verrucomicrobiota bacterium]